MLLDFFTLTVAFVLLYTVLAALLLFSWNLNRKVEALAWWGGAFLFSGIGIGIVNLGGPPGYAALLIGNALVLLAYGAFYTGCRVFNGRRASPLAVLAGGALWAAAFPFIYGSYPLRLVLVSFICGAYSGWALWELWKNAPQRLASQQVAAVLLLLLTVFNVLRGVFGVGSTSVPLIDTLAQRWSQQMALLLLAFGPPLAFVFMSMVKERDEYVYKQEALVDSLTGVPNRRAFLRNADSLLSRNPGRPATCLLFDLDNFKSINDGYGHDAGDRVLKLFGQILTRHLPEQTFGRLGGEEFGAILPLEEREAVELAETIRRDFAAAGEKAADVHADISVSIGCATATGISCQDLIQRADIALYRAKTSGRNRVVVV